MHLFESASLFVSVYTAYLANLAWKGCIALTFSSTLMHPTRFFPQPSHTRPPWSGMPVVSSPPSAPGPMEIETLPRSPGGSQSDKRR